jgi:NAD-dependent deacetylase
VPGTGLYNSAVSVERLAELIRTCRPCVVLSGAGVSTESGIPDFRSPSGIWAEYDPMEYATIEAFRVDPVKVWDFYGRRLRMLTRARPNDAHKALAALEHDGYVRAVVTQNVDRLHHLAGSRDVVEVHGSIRTATCLACGESITFDEVLQQLEDGPAPRCPLCGEVPKPDVVMFGQLLPAAAIEQAVALVESTRLLLVVGSSLAVFPVAALPETTLAAGGQVAIVNAEPTPYDDRASIVIHARAGETLAVVRRLLPQPGT